MDTSEIGFKQHANGIAEIILQRQQKHNALSPNMIQGLLERLQHCERNDSIKVVVLRALGATFCSGADLQWMKDSIDHTFEQNVEDAKHLSELLHTLYQLPQPTIAVIQGNCFGGGVGLVTCCDIALASNNIHFCFSEVSLGLTPAIISPYVVRRVGEAHTRRLFFTAEKIHAEEAKMMGLIHNVVSSDELNTHAAALCEQLLKNSSHAIRECKKLIAEVSMRPIDQTLRDYTVNEIARMRTSESGQRGMRAFLDKRKINWNV